MNQSIFQENLSALEHLNPDCARVVVEASLAEPTIELIPTKTNLPSARVSASHSSKPILLHSAYHPMREAQRWAETIEILKPLNIFLLGFGLGYHLHALIQKHQANIRHLIVIEQDPRLLKLALSTMDFRPLLTRNNFELIVGQEPELIPELIEDQRRDLILNNFKLLQHDPSSKISPDYYQQVHQILLEQITHDEVNLRTTFYNQGRGQFNILMNLPAIAKGYAPKDCAGLLTGYPAIVAAAGPSLDKNIDQLKNIHDRALLCIVDTAQKPFQNKQIKPHVIVTGDPTELNFSHFEAISSLDNALLAFHPEANRKITQKFCHHPYLLPMFDKKCRILDYLFDIDHTYGTIDRAMNVGHLAFNVAKHLGCAPIILVGFDFAFPRDGGKTHASDAALSRTVSKMQDDGTIGIGGKDGKASAESGKMKMVPGYYDDLVPTTVPFMQYIRAIKQEVSQCQFEVIDATEGGAYFEGTTRMPLQQAMQTHLAHSGIQETLNHFFASKHIHCDITDIANKLHHGQQTLLQGKNTCQTLLQRVHYWKQLIAQGTVSQSLVDQEWHEFDQIWCNMVGDPIFNDFLGDSVQYLYFARQRQNQPANPTPEMFLKVLTEKYDYIVSELMGLLERFAHAVELAQIALQQNRLS